MRRWALRLALFVAASGCDDEFPSEGNSTLAVDSTLGLAYTAMVRDTDTVALRLQGENDVQVAGITVRWESSDPARVEVRPITPAGRTRRDTLAALLQVQTIAHARGSARVTATVEQPGVATLAVEHPITVLERWVAVTAGDQYSCGLTVDLAAYCWGGQGVGASPQESKGLGNGTSIARERPFPVTGNLRFSALVAGDDQTCGMEASTALLYCWGENGLGELGIGGLDDTRIPTLTVGGRNFAQVSVRRGLTCGITTTDQDFDQGHVNTYCWGLASLRGLQWMPPTIDAVSCGPGLCSPKPQMPIGFTIADFLLRTVSVGGRYACGILESDFGSVLLGGEVWCWGADDRGQLGESQGLFDEPLAQCDDPDVGTTSPCSLAPRRLLGGLKFNTIDAGPAHVCGASRSGPVYCWGGRYGTTPVEVPGPALDSAIVVTVGGRWTDLDHFHACVLDLTGQAYCWGDNINGELGNGELPASGAPVYHPNLQPVQQDTLRFVAISAGKGADERGGRGVGHTCALTADGVIYCWGSNGAGALGDPAVDRTAVPTRIAEPEL